jgi:hypothetical protein
MNQMGNTSSGTQQIDQLTYQYGANSNQLMSVSDPSGNYGLGDFVDGNTSGNDYHYDADGNMDMDLNKGIQAGNNTPGITYNYQDLPTTITVNNGPNLGTIQNVYDANGRLIKKTVTSNNTPTVYQYCGPFVYKNNDLQYELTEEGRCRWLTDSLFFKYEYFVTDHLGNVRTVLTSDAYQGGNLVATTVPFTYQATYEVAAANTENAIFDNVSNLAVDNPNPTVSDMKAALLYGGSTNRQIGTSIMLHVMAGDKFDASALTYWVDTSVDRVYTNAPQMITCSSTRYRQGQEEQEWQKAPMPQP